MLRAMKMKAFANAWVLVVLLAVTARAQNVGLAGAVWPMLGGSRLHHSASTFLGPPASTLGWRFDAGAPVVGGVAIDADGAVFFADANGSIYALEQSGQERWSRTDIEPAVGVPALGRDGRIYVGSAEGSLFALDRRTGIGSAIFDAGSPITTSTSIARDGTVYFGTKRGLSAVDPAGNPVWTAAIGEIRGSSPAVSREGTIFVGTARGRVIALAPDGSILWNRQVASAANNLLDVHVDVPDLIRLELEIGFDRAATVGTPTIGPNGRIYVGAVDGRLRALDAADGRVIWTFAAGAPIRSGVSLAPDGTLYLGTDGGVLHHVRDDGGSARVLWAATIGSPVRSTPVVDRVGTVYVGADDQLVHALAASDGGTLWQFATQGPVRSALAIGVGGRVFAGSNDHGLYAVGDFRAGKDCWAEASLDPDGLTEIETNKLYQTILAVCGGPETDSCEAAVVASANHDRTAAAIRVMSREMTPAHYLALARDRSRKIRALKGGGGLGLCKVAARDGDGDLVDDNDDRCPDTAPLTPTFDDGCEDAGRPDVGDSEQVHQFLDATAMVFDEVCRDAVPNIPVPFALLDYPGNPDGIRRKFIWLRHKQPAELAACKLWYEIEIVAQNPGAPPRSFYLVIPSDRFRESSPDFTDRDVVFVLDQGMPGAYGAFASFEALPQNGVDEPGEIGPQLGILGYRMRATNHGGGRSPWSRFVTPGLEDRK